jgi:hypothetical protein
MIDSADAAILQTIVRRESRSLLQYISDAFPWTSPDEQPLLGRLRKMIVAEQQAVAGVTLFLQRQRVTPAYLGPYPQSFTNVNYVSLDYLMPMLVAAQQKALADLDRDAAALHDAEAVALVQNIVAVKRRHLESLTKQPAPDSQPAAVH